MRHRLHPKDDNEVNIIGKHQLESEEKENDSDHIELEEDLEHLLGILRLEIDIEDIVSIPNFA